MEMKNFFTKIISVKGSTTEKIFRVSLLFVYENVHAFFTLHCNVLKNVGLCCQEKVFYNTRTRKAPVPIVTGFQFDWSTSLFNRPTPILTGQLTSSPPQSDWVQVTTHSVILI